jgi:hypothetical protein
VAFRQENKRLKTENNLKSAKIRAKKLHQQAAALLELKTEKIR